jgi:hypothetical protein
MSERSGRISASRRDPHLGELAAALVDGVLDHSSRDRALTHLTRCDGCRAEVEAQRRIKSQLAGLAGPALSPGFADRLRMLPDRSPAVSAAELPAERFGARFRPGARPRARGRALESRPLTIAGAAELSPIPLAPGHSAYAEVAVAARVAPSRPVVAASGPGRRSQVQRPDVQRPDSPRPGAQRGGGRRRLSRRAIAATAAGGLAAFALGLATVAAAGGADDLQPVSPPVGTFTVEHSRVTGGAPGPNPEVGAADAAVTHR